ncbi:MAG: leucyl aminopeptidase [Candidatus Roizmanbacteria bacterium]|nr:leucyl aminopeptidase [Candidatus Roizmanbacteria bacterium]
MTPAIHIKETYTNQNSFHIYFSHTGTHKYKNIPKELQTIIQLKAERHEFAGKDTDILHIEQATDKGIGHIVILGLGDEAVHEVKNIRNQISKAVHLARNVKALEIVVHIGTYGKDVQTIVEGVLIGDYSFDTFKGKESQKKHPHVNNVYIETSETAEVKKAVEKGINTASALLLTRDMVNTPASHLHPETLVNYAKEIEKKAQGKVDVTVLNEQECKKLGMGAFLGVAQGSERKPAFIVLHYKGSGTKKFAFVGKSITFDSGGLSLKPSEGMMDMKIDMAGGAAVLGVFDYLASQKPLVSTFSDVYGVLPACENMPSGKAMKPGDVVTAMNGKTVEVLNTDAEGRLALADALVYAETVLKADYIIDMATLTGACMVALGNDLAGLFSNDDAFEKKYAVSAGLAGDDYWRMPLHSAYLAHMKSTIADLKNISTVRYGGAITAAIFLKEFIKKAKWMHIDIAGPAHSDKNGASGWGVLSVIYFLEPITKV